MPFWKRLRRLLNFKEDIRIELKRAINMFNSMIDRLKASALGLREMYDERRRQAEELAEKGVDIASIIPLYEEALICKEMENMLYGQIRRLEELVELLTELLNSLGRTTPSCKETLKRIERIRKLYEELTGFSAEYLITVSDDMALGKIEDRAGFEKLHEELVGK